MSTRWGYSGSWVNASSILEDGVDHRQSDLPVGVYLTVKYNGEQRTTFVVPPIPDNPYGYWRYVFDGERYRTLSNVAQQITGDPNTSGNRFWRLRRRKRGRK
jgi:hypothetical protein